MEVFNLGMLPVTLGTSFSPIDQRVDMYDHATRKSRFETKFQKLEFFFSEVINCLCM